MGRYQLYKMKCCGRVTRTLKGNWDVCYTCGAKKPILEEVDKEDDVLFVGKDWSKKPEIKTTVGDTLVGRIEDGDKITEGEEGA